MIPVVFFYFSPFLLDHLEKMLAYTIVLVQRRGIHTCLAYLVGKHDENPIPTGVLLFYTNFHIKYTNPSHLNTCLTRKKQNKKLLYSLLKSFLFFLGQSGQTSITSLGNHSSKNKNSK